MFPSAINGCREAISNNMELDIYIPEYRLGIEYDGGKWHQEHVDRGLKKYDLCKKNGIFLVKMTDLILDVDDADRKYHSRPEPTDEDYQRVVDFVSEYTNYDGERIIVNVEADRYEILLRYKKTKFERSFAYKNPEALKYWNYERNGNVDPYGISANDVHKFWFTSPEYGEYMKSPNQITSGKTHIYHPKESIEKAMSCIRKRIVVYDVETGVCSMLTYRETSGLTGLGMKNISKITCKKNILGHLTYDRKFILLNVSERNDEEIREILLENHLENAIIGSGK
jgi:hypothetical protein